MFNRIKSYFVNLFAGKVLDDNYRLQKEVEELKAINDNKNTDSQVSIRIPRKVYEDFRKGLPNYQLNDSSTDIVAAQKLGVALVLSKLEKELVI